MTTPVRGRGNKPMIPSPLSSGMARPPVRPHERRECRERYDREGRSFYCTCVNVQLPQATGTHIPRYNVPAEGMVMTNKPDELSPVVFVVDDDELVLSALSELFESVGLRAETFG